MSLKVDGDPHFIVQLPKLHQNLCFTIDGKADDVLRLLEDPDKGGFMILHPIYSFNVFMETKQDALNAF